MTEWKALEILDHAHRVGEEKLKNLESAIEDLKGGRTGEATAGIKGLLVFFNEELRKHFEHEEVVLFPLISRAIGPMGPVTVMLDEHRSLWNAIDRLEEEIEGIEAGAGQDSAEAQRVASYILWALRSHIQKEDEMLFPLAVAQLSEMDKRSASLAIERMAGAEAVTSVS